MSLLGGKIIYPVRLGKSAIHGSGVFAAATIPARKKIGTMGGTIVSARQANKHAKERQVIKLVELGNGKALDGSVNGNELCCMNHSCSPNSYIRVIGHEVEFYALRKIKPEEEITCSYGASYHEGKKHCGCGAENCVEFF